MDDTPLGRFFGVVARSRTWLNLLFQIIAFPLGLFYFIFLVIGLSVGLGLVIIWVGIPILLVVAGAWWLFGAFERLQARALLGADVPDAPRSWETVPGVWGKVKAHFGNGATWKDLLYLLAKLAFGVVSFTLVVTLASIIGWLFALPFVSHWHVAAFDYGNGQEWIPPLWLGLLGIPAAILMIFASLHVLNAWGWVCKRWAEVMFRVAPAAPVSAAPPAPLVSTSPQPPALLVAQPAVAPRGAAGRRRARAASDAAYRRSAGARGSPGCGAGHTARRRACGGGDRRSRRTVGGTADRRARRGSSRGGASGRSCRAAGASAGNGLTPFRGLGGREMNVERPHRILRPSMALVALALGVIVLGGLIAAPVRAAGQSTRPAATASAFDTSKADEPIVKAGEDVVVPAGTSTQTVVAAGGDVTVHGVVTGAVVAFGGDVVVDGKVQTSVVAFGGDITVKGSVGASVVAFGGDVQLLPGSVVGTSMKSSDKTVVLFGGDLTRSPSAQVTGATAVYEGANWAGAGSWFGGNVVKGAVLRPWWGFSIIGWLVQAAICLVLGLVAAALLPTQMRAIQHKLAEKTAASLGWGALMFFVVVPAVLVVLVISIVGLLLVLPYAVFMALFYFFVITSVGAAVASWALSGTKHRENLFLAVVIGVLATTAVSKIPVAGALVLAAMAVFGAGAALQAYGDHRRARRAAMTPAPAGGPAGPAPSLGSAPVDVPPAAAAAAGAQPATSAATAVAATAMMDAGYLPATPPVPPESQTQVQAAGAVGADATAQTAVVPEAAAPSAPAVSESAGTGGEVTGVTETVAAPQPPAPQAPVAPEPPAGQQQPPAEPQQPPTHQAAELGPQAEAAAAPPPPETSPEDPPATET